MGAAIFRGDEETEPKTVLAGLNIAPGKMVERGLSSQPAFR
jgi:hypothetical protein